MIVFGLVILAISFGILLISVSRMILPSIRRDRNTIDAFLFSIAFTMLILAIAIITQQGNSQFFTSVGIFALLSSVGLALFAMWNALFAPANSRIFAQSGRIFSYCVGLMLFGIILIFIPNLNLTALDTNAKAVFARSFFNHKIYSPFLNKHINFGFICLVAFLLLNAFLIKSGLKLSRFVAGHLLVVAMLTAVFVLSQPQGVNP